MIFPWAAVASMVSCEVLGGVADHPAFTSLRLDDIPGMPDSFRG